jgi:hypothetical protein
MHQYLELAYEDTTSSPVQFWNKHKTSMPQLHQLALLYLSVLTTSVPSERTFSKAGLIMNNRQNKLKEKILDFLVFLNSNFM